MDTTTLLLAGGLLYLLLRQPAAPMPPTLPITQRGGYAISGPGGTVVSIPGLGQYTQLPGQGTAITFDPRLFSGWMQPATVQPTDTAPTQPLDAWATNVQTIPSDPGYGAGDWCAENPDSYLCL